MKLIKDKFRKPLGIFLIILGIISVLTPFTPFGILLLIGLELLGVRETYSNKIKAWFAKKRVM